ncbi:MAG: serine hydrolase [Gemmatimonadota bacterium]|nr:serine hydrolase [Gemmatimonadota bacterium]
MSSIRRPALRAPAFAFLFGLAALSPVEAQNDVDTSNRPSVAEALGVVEVWLDAQRDYEEIPGLSAAIVHDQETLWTGAYGYAHPASETPATPGTIYSICSISKLFTSISLMQLRDRGLVRLSDPVAEHLDWFDVKRTFPDEPPVTVEGILTHSAGLPRESNHPYWSAPDFAFPTRADIIADLSEQETLYPAWRYFQYSNLGLTLAGELVRELSGLPFEEYVRANVLEPLGLDDTRPRMPEELRGGRLASGYSAITREGVREPVNFFQARGIAPAAGFTSTVEDLARFASWQFRLEGDAEEVLHAHTLREMHRVHYVDPEFEVYWGLGFAVSRSDGTTFVGHGGSCPGYRSQLLLQLDDRLATVFMASASGVNTGKYVRGMYELLAPAIEAAAGDDAGEMETAAGEDEAAPSKDRPDLSRYVGAYSAFPWGGETAVVRWKGSLATLSLPSDDPAEGLTRLKHIEGHTFRRIRDDDELGERITFETDADGEVVAMVRFENRSPKVR